MVPRKMTRAQSTQQAAAPEVPSSPEPAEPSREERRKSLRPLAHGHIDQEGLHLAEAWGVAPGSEAWVQLMTEFCIATTLQPRQGLPATDSPSSAASTARPEAGRESDSSPSSGKDEDGHGPSGTQQDPVVVRDPTSSPPKSFSPLSSPPPSPPRSGKPQRKTASVAPIFAMTLAPLTTTRKRRAETGPPVEEPAPRRTRRADSAIPTPDPIHAPLTEALDRRRSIRQQSTVPEANAIPPAPQPCRTTRQQSALTPTTSTNPGSDNPPSPSRRDDGSRYFKCPYAGCKYSEHGFNRQEHLRRHVATIHEKIIIATCEDCGRGFTRKDNWQQHVAKCAKVMAMEVREEAGGGEV